MIRGTHGRAATIGSYFLLVAIALFCLVGDLATGQGATEPHGGRDAVQAAASSRPAVAPAGERDARTPRPDRFQGLVGWFGLVLVGAAALFVGWTFSGRRAAVRGGTRHDVLGRAPPAFA